MKKILLMTTTLILAACSSTPTNPSNTINPAEQALQGEWLNENKQLGLKFEGDSVSEIASGEVQNVAKFHVEINEQGEETLIIADNKRQQRIRLQRDVNRLILKSRREFILRRAVH